MKPGVFTASDEDGATMTAIPRAEEMAFMVKGADGFVGVIFLDHVMVKVLSDQLNRWLDIKDMG